MFLQRDIIASYNSPEVWLHLLWMVYAIRYKAKIFERLKVSNINPAGLRLKMRW